MAEHAVDRELDARGLNCPMPLVKARQEVGALRAGQVLKVVATDRGSLKDFQGWARVAKNIALLEQQTLKEGTVDLYVHFLKKTAD
ncbi:MAG: sulfurtransferase TusA family protein [Candidatus Eiseniibacteriota bacterium]